MFDVKTYREQIGLTMQELADAVGVSKSTVSKWEKGSIKNMRRDKIEKLAIALKIKPSLIIGMDSNKDDTISTPENARPLPPVLSCDYYHSVSAGIGIGAEKHSEKYNYWFTSQSQADRCFAVDVEGDSMEPELHDGDVVIVDTEEPYVNDDIVVFYDKSDELGFIKKYRKTNDYVMFISINTAYDAMIFPLSDFADRIKIHGKVIASNRKY